MRCPGEKRRTAFKKEEKPVFNEELQALMMLIDSMQKDFEQTTILINIVTDFIKKNCKRRVVLETL